MNRRRLITGVEKLAAQGIFPNMKVLTSLPNYMELAGDLAGNAFNGCAPVLM